MEQSTKETSGNALEAEVGKLTDMVGYQEGAVVSRVVLKNSALLNSTG